MSCSQFIDQVQILMHTQQMKYWEILFEKSTNYAWLSNKKFTLTFISGKDEFLLRQALQKVNQEERIKVMRQLVSWLDEHPHAQAHKVPETCILLLNRLSTINVINEVTLSRKNSFRNSLRRLSILSNKVSPMVFRKAVTSPQTEKRCVKFKEEPTVYCIRD
ncbi:hypothetical protein ILUMI_20611 [Ignelater luminosus]|uniref:Uncharacterized protein n=1 Tax=Ignelater luminosus TaxID=2038154 RepID=A0A8K0CJC0_IGNLU|nr:hypothetical protein ILUMI_20611 [Ignelater luminosus]